MTIRDVANHLGVGWDLIKEIQKADLQRRFKKVKLKKLRQLAIDEISIGKHHRYLTVVLDLKSGAVVFVGDGKGSQPWSRFGSGCGLPGQDPGRRHGHVAGLHQGRQRAAAQSPDRVRSLPHHQAVQREALRLATRTLPRGDRQLHKHVLKGTRWLLLMNPEHLDPKRNERQRLEKALELNAPLATAYYLKEDLRQLWQQPDWRTARKYLTSWCARAMASKIRILQQFARTLRKHAWGILNYFKFPISTGPLEGTNNKIRTLQRNAYGFRDHEFFKLKIYALHETRYELVG